MDSHNNKILLGLAVVSLSISGFVIWYLLSSPTPDQSYALSRAGLQDGTEDTLEQLSDAALPNVDSRRVPAAPISKGLAVSAQYMDQGRLRYYDPETGKTWQVNSDGTGEELISGANLPGFLRTYWSPNKHEVITAFTTSRGTSYKYFDHASKRSVSLGTHIESLVFSPDGFQIAYFTKTADGGALYLASPDGQESKKIFSTRLRNMQVSWPTRDTLAFTTTDEQTSLTSFFLLSLDNKLTKLIDSLPGLEIRWSPDGSQFVFSHFTDDGLLTAYQGRETHNPVLLDIRARAPHCAWSSDQTALICAASQTPISLAVIKTQSKTPSDFFEISLNEGTKKLLYSSGTRSAKAHVSQILLSLTGDYVFFINSYDSKLYSFKR
jgi:hypothetical protein